MWDVQRATLTRLTFAQGVDWFPLWTPDGRRIVFSSAGDGGSINLFWMPADGTGKPGAESALVELPRAPVLAATVQQTRNAVQLERVATGGFRFGNQREHLAR